MSLPDTFNLFMKRSIIFTTKKYCNVPKTPKKIIDQAHTDLGKMGDLLDKLEKGKKY